MPANGKYPQCAVLVVIWAVIYLGSLSGPALFDDADTVHAEAVREMVSSGDWVTLRIDNGLRYLEKAPFMYWMSALSVKLFGLTDWAVRLPVALFSLFLTLLIYRFGNRFWGEKAGFYSALVYVTSLGPYAFTRIFLPDVILAFFMALSFYFYLQVVFDPEPSRKLFGRWDRRALGIYASAAMAVLTKGLVGVIFVGLVILAHIALTKRWGILKKLEIIPGIVLFLLIAAPWHLAAGFSNKGFFWFYFMNEHFLRYLGLRYPKDYDTVPRWLFWTLHMAWLFPWTAYAWGFMKTFPRKPRPESRTDQINLFLYLWILLILIFFSFSTTQEYYTFPTLSAFALLLGQVLAWVDSKEGIGDHRKARIGLAIVAGVSVLIGAGLFSLAWLGQNMGHAGDLSSTLTINPDKYALSFGHIHDLTSATFGHLASLVYRTALLFLIGPTLAFIVSFRRRWQLSAFCLALTMMGVLQCYHGGMIAFQPILSSSGLAQTIQSQYRPEDRIFINGVYERGSSINYYTHIQVSILNGHFGNLWYGSFYPDAPHIFYDDDSFLELWGSRQRIFLFSEDQPFEKFLRKHPDFNYRLLAREGEKKVVVNW